MGIELLLQPREVPYQLVYGIFKQFEKAFEIEPRKANYDELKKHYQGFVEGALHLPRTYILFEPLPNHFFYAEGRRSARGTNFGLTTFRGMYKQEYGIETPLHLPTPEPSLRGRFFEHRTRSFLHRRNYKNVLIPRRTMPRPRFPDSRFISTIYAEA